MLQPSGPWSHPCKGGEPWGDSEWERTGHWPQTGEVHTKGTVTRRSQFWLHAGSVSLPMASHCFGQGTLPLCLNVKLKWLFSAHRETIWLSPHVNDCRKEIWLYFFTSSPLCSIKEPGIQIPIRWLFWDISLLSSQSARFPNKVIILCLNTLSVRLISIVRWGEWAWTW